MSNSKARWTCSPGCGHDVTDLKLRSSHRGAQGATPCRPGPYRSTFISRGCPSPVRGDALSVARRCPACGFALQAAEEVCTNCGAAAIPTKARSEPRDTPVPDHLGPRPWNYALWRSVDRTQLGLTAMAIGIVVGWLAGFTASLYILSVAAAVTFLVGAVLVFLGRDVFGPTHATLAFLALSLLAIVFVGSYIVVGSFWNRLASALAAQPYGFQGDYGAALFSGAMTDLLVGTALLGGLASLASMLVVDRLEPFPGRVVVWSACVGNIAVLAGMAWAMSTAMSQAASLAFGSGYFSPDPILAAANEMYLFQGLAVVPTALYVLGFYLARRAIHEGPASQPTSDAAAPSPEG